MTTPPPPDPAGPREAGPIVPGPIVPGSVVPGPAGPEAAVPGPAVPASGSAPGVPGPGPGLPGAPEAAGNEPAPGPFGALGIRVRTLDNVRSSFAVADAIAAGVLVLVLAVLGAGTAWIWSAFAPHVQVLISSDGPVLDGYDAEAFMANDGVFGVVGLVVGVVVGLLAYGLRRFRGPLVVVGLALGCLAGSWVCSRVGMRIGRSDYEAFLSASVPGRRDAMPLELRATGMLGVQAIAAVAVYVVVAAWASSSDLGAGRRRRRTAGPAHAGPAHAVPTADRAPTAPPAPYTAATAPTPPVSSTTSAPGAPPAGPEPHGAGTASSPPA